MGSMPSIPVPPALDAARLRGPAWAGWLDALPRRAGDLLEEWCLQPDGEAMHGRCSLVLPVRAEDGAPTVLKIGFPDEESEHEHLALQHWGGRGAVSLVRADPHRRALLLERLHREDLGRQWDLDACRVVAESYASLHRPAPPQLRSLADQVARWRDELGATPRDAGIPPRLVDQARSIAAGLVDDPGTTGTLVHTDLHYGNVLAGDRQPWLVIDPKPLSGDPHCELAPMLWNRWREVEEGSGALRWTMRERFAVLVDTAGLDEDRARAWAVLRLVMYALDAAARHDTDEVTAMLRVLKAVQD